MKNPYQQQPARSFWRQAVQGKETDGFFKELWEPKFPISKQTRFVTFGSCFAQHFSKWLFGNGFSWVDGETAPEALTSDAASEQGYGVFSVRTGNIYTVAILKQWMQLALGTSTVHPEIAVKEGAFFDTLRPLISKSGFSSESALMAARELTYSSLIKAIRHSDVFVFTLGLTEGWESHSGYAYTMCPGTEIGVFDAEKHLFKNYSYDAILKDLNTTLELIQQINPNVRFILTVSPVPLTASASAEHVLSATTYSKSVLRAVAGFLHQTREDVDYFPSYELITSPPVRGAYFESNMRSVRPEGVEFVMQHFSRGIGEKFSHAPVSRVESVPIEAAESSDIFCDDILLDTWHTDDSDAGNSNICLLGDSHLGKISKALRSANIPHAGGMIMSGSSWTGNLFHLDDSDEFFVPLEDAGARQRWQATLPFFRSDKNPKIVITNIGIQSHRNVKFIFEHFIHNGIEINFENFSKYFMEQNAKQIQLLNKIKGVPDVQLIVITDPPTQGALEGNAVDFFILYDNWVEVIFDYLGCRVLNARKVIQGIGFDASFYSNEKAENGDVDWYHGSDAYYDIISKELVDLINHS
jgi:GSCFA family